MPTASILIVDDNPVNLSVLRALLSRDDYDLVASDGGQSAIDLAKANPSFDLVMLDVAMPDLDGIEVCRQIKADAATAHIPILLISAYRTDEASIREGLEAGADGYLTQPIEDMALRAWVKATLRISKLQRELTLRGNDGGSGTPLMERFAKLSHGVNNPLQALYAAADLLALEMDENSGGQELIHEIIDNAEQVAKMVAEASLAAKQELQK